MKLRDPVAEEEVQAVIERGRHIRPAPDVVRARLLARARVAVARSAPATRVALPETAPAWRGRRLAFAVAALLLFTTAGATAALYVHARRSVERATRSVQRATRSVQIVPTARRSPETTSVVASASELPAAETDPAPQLVSRPKLQRPHRPLSPQESYAAELYLLQRAQSDYASHDFPDALVLVAEHARQFPNGRLAEEREALRVRSLAGAGRGDQARRALAAFATRFPRSVLLPRLREQTRAAE
jgi:hypothetical protein